MRTLFYSFIFAATLVSCGGSANRSDNSKNIKSKTLQINIKGSDTELPLTEKEMESFLNKYPDESISVTGGGSSVGITALIEGNTDIAMASRDLTSEENIKLSDAGQDISKITVAFDALAIIVNPANPIDKISKEQLVSIYTGKSNNWKDLGASDALMGVVGRENSSGTFQFFREHVLGGKNCSPGMVQLSSNGQIVESIAHSPNAIGYVGMGYVNSNVKVLAVSFDGGQTFVQASVPNVKNKTYKIARALYYIHSAGSAAKVQPFINYVLSDSGQKIVEKAGFVRAN